MTTCYFYVLSPDFNNMLGSKEFESFAAARAFLREIVTNNIDALEQINGYLAMLCQIAN